MRNSTKEREEVNMQRMIWGNPFRVEVSVEALSKAGWRIVPSTLHAHNVCFVQHDGEQDKNGLSWGEHVFLIMEKEEAIDG